MNQASPEAQRAERLAAYLDEDPANPLLLADACDAAMAAGFHAAADGYIRTAEALGLAPAEWTFRRARLCIVQRRLDQAAALLAPLQADANAHPAVAHDLAYVRLLQGAPQACREIVGPWLAQGIAHGPDLHEALQVLWLRATHHLQLLEEGWHWAQAEHAAQRLQPAACGVASLLALDLGRFDDARSLADAAIGVRPAQVEALVARATVALGDRDTAGATDLLRRALACNPEDGRTWSALGLCSLQARDLPLAQSRLERAVRTLPGHVGTWHALGWARLLQQDAAGALAAFREALRLDRNFAESHGAVGLVLALTGDREGATRHLDLAGRLDPSNVTGRYARALLAGEGADAVQMRALAERLLDRPAPGGGSMGDAVLRAMNERTRPRGH
ncbi:MAG: hypothetical protein EOO24_21905, partial [Comamonadaceae bacterium]